MLILCRCRIRFAEEHTAMDGDDGWHRWVATGVGKRAEAAEGLYLGWGERYSRRKRGCGISSWSRGVMLCDG
jgi:hypothetical protein